MNKKKLLQLCILNPKNINFSDFVIIIEWYGFTLNRVNGSHHIFKHPFVDELINIQNVKGQAKPYQIRQFLKIVETYNLKFEAES